MPKDLPSYITTSQRSADEVCRPLAAEAETSRKPRYTAPACGFRVENFLQLGFCAIHPAKPRQRWGESEKRQLHAVQIISVDFSWGSGAQQIPDWPIVDVARVRRGLRDFSRNAAHEALPIKITVRAVMARDYGQGVTEIIFTASDGIQLLILDTTLKHIYQH